MPIIDLTRNIMHMTCTTRIFLNCVLNTNVNIRGENSLIWMNHRVLINMRDE